VPTGGGVLFDQQFQTDVRTGAYETKKTQPTLIQKVNCVSIESRADRANQKFILP
jgi:hypothetical protein